MKVCRICHVEKNLDEFNKHHSTRDKLAHECKACQREAGRASHIRRTYGITMEEYNRMFEEQEGVCAICGQPGKAMEWASRWKTVSRVSSCTLYVDHDHSTGTVRGLLCHDCNMALGIFKESTIVLRTAIAYLNNHAKKQQST